MPAVGRNRHRPFTEPSCLGRFRLVAVPAGKGRLQNGLSGRSHRRGVEPASPGKPPTDILTGEARKNLFPAVGDIHVALPARIAYAVGGASPVVRGGGWSTTPPPKPCRYSLKRRPPFRKGLNQHRGVTSQIGSAGVIKSRNGSRSCGRVTERIAKWIDAFGRSVSKTGRRNHERARWWRILVVHYNR